MAGCPSGSCGIHGVVFMGRLRGIMVMLSTAFGVLVFGGTGYLCGFFGRSRRVMAWVARNWSRSALLFTGARITVEGRERLEAGRAYFLVGNHQSALDIPIVMLAMHGDVRFTAKESLFKTPIFGQVMRHYGYVPIDRSNARKALRALEAAVERMQDDPISFAVFPEGTRSTDGRLLPFRKGALKIAKLSGMPVVPFAIDGAWRVNNRMRKDIRPGPIRLVLHEPIPVEQLACMDSSQLHDRIVGMITDTLGESPAEASTAPKLPETTSA